MKWMLTLNETDPVPMALGPKMTADPQHGMPPPFKRVATGVFLDPVTGRMHTELPVPPAAPKAAPAKRVTRSPAPGDLITASDAASGSVTAGKLKEGALASQRTILPGDRVMVIHATKMKELIGATGTVTRVQPHINGPICAVQFQPGGPPLAFRASKLKIIPRV